MSDWAAFWFAASIVISTSFIADAMIKIWGH